MTRTRYEAEVPLDRPREPDTDQPDDWMAGMWVVPEAGSERDRPPMAEAYSTPASGDDLAAALEEIREGERAAPRAAMRRLLAAAEAVLDLADGADVIFRSPFSEDDARAIGWTLDPAKVREAITRALSAEQAMASGAPMVTLDDRDPRAGKEQR